MGNKIIEVFAITCLILSIVFIGVIVALLLFKTPAKPEITYLTDAETGCKYVIIKSTVLPRTRIDGKQVCIPVEPLPATD